MREEVEASLGPRNGRRNASTEFAGAVKTVPSPNAQEGDKLGDLNKEENFEPDSRKTGDEAGDLFDQSQFEEMDPAVRKRAKEVFKRLKSTITVIPLSLHERREKVVETFVSNDDRPESSLAARGARRIDHDEKGVPYIRKGARSSSLLLKAVGPLPMAIKMALPYACSSQNGFKWAVIDECWTISESNITPLERGMFIDPTPWNEASGVANRVLRYGGKGIAFREGGWVDAYTVLTAVSHDFRRRHPTDIVRQIAATDWLFALRTPGFHINIFFCSS